MDVKKRGGGISASPFRKLRLNIYLLLILSGNFDMICCSTKTMECIPT